LPLGLLVSASLSLTNPPPNPFDGGAVGSTFITQGCIGSMKKKKKKNEELGIQKLIPLAI